MKTTVLQNDTKQLSTDTKFKGAFQAKINAMQASAKEGNQNNNDKTPEHIKKMYDDVRKTK